MLHCLYNLLVLPLYKVMFVAGVCAGQTNLGQGHCSLKPVERGHVQQFEQSKASAKPKVAE
jgi:hypothetical protein